MFVEYQFYVYILANHKRGTLYTGVTSDLLDRAYQHKQRINPKSFCSRYGINKLVYYEIFDNVYDAICREKQIKAGSRNKKIELIEKDNPEWHDLFDDFSDL